MKKIWLIVVCLPSMSFSELNSQITDGPEFVNMGTSFGISVESSGQLLQSGQQATNLILNEIRQLYRKSAGSEAACKKILSKLWGYNEMNNPLLAGYKASASMIMAKHVVNPLSKLSWFRKGKTLMENAVAADKTNIELRMLRFAVQSNTPGFLGYNSAIKKDKLILLRSHPSITDPTLKTLVADILSGSSHLTAAEKQKLKNTGI